MSINILKEMVRRYGTTDCVMSGQQGLEMFLRAHEAKSPYDVIFMDIMMPGIDGLSAVRKIRDNEEMMNITALQRARIIMTTALSDPETVIKALYESDADLYLVKPINQKAISNALRELKLISSSVDTGR
ncbi:MAG TPA: response regulator [Desulfuromonadales bacterium]|nr:response regulator [Desulfuromonadales bacterium]